MRDTQERLQDRVIFRWVGDTTEGNCEGVQRRPVSLVIQEGSLHDRKRVGEGEGQEKGFSCVGNGSSAPQKVVQQGHHTHRESASPQHLIRSTMAHIFCAGRDAHQGQCISYKVITVLTLDMSLMSQVPQGARFPKDRAGTNASFFLTQIC